MVLTTGVLGSPLGCLHPTPPSAFTQADRLMAHYPALRGGHFAVIADFEDRRHASLFSVDNVSGQAVCAIDRRSGHGPTGRSCLRVRLGGPDDALVINADTSTDWFLKRDWRDYDLLLVNLHATTPGARLQLSLAGGWGESRAVSATTLALKRGWNPIELDLAQPGERVPLDDIREIRLRSPNADAVLEFRIDDILLAGNVVSLLGDPRDTDGGMYVQRQGHHWNVGSGGQFELTFANGQIVAWFDLVNDPDRLGNLVRNTVLGPSPAWTVRSDGSRPADGEAKPTKSITFSTRQRLVEMSPVRVVVECMLYASQGFGADDSTEAIRHLTYTVYPTGQIYARIRHSTASAKGLGPASAMVVSVGGKPGWKDHAAVAGAANGGDQSGAPTYATVCQTSPRGAQLVFALPPADRPHIVKKSLDSATGVTQLVAMPPSSAEEHHTAACHITVTNAGEDWQGDTDGRAWDYYQPAHLGMEIGRLITGVGGDAGQPGFDFGAGCYTLEPEGGVVRFVIDGSSRPRHSPAFRILGGLGSEVWVYVDHRVHRRVARESDGAVVFQIDGVIRHRALVEVFFRRE